MTIRTLALGALAASVSIVGAGVGPFSSTAHAAVQSIRCESQDQHRTWCAVPWDGDVRISQQISNAPCERGRTWGYDLNRQHIWVADGCRADFTVFIGDGQGYRPGWDGGASGGQVVRCESQDLGHHECVTDSRGPAHIAHQLSDAPCIRGRTWGFDHHRIWVDAGCRADFVVR